MKQTKVTFWQLLQEYSIEIPTIQRDYTYGREDAKAIGRKLVKSIFDALSDQRPLPLDFIYGKLEGKQNFEMLEKNKQSIESLLSSIKTYASGLHLQVEYKADKQSICSAEIITFIPLDGQQRLTTLFLIHWYLAVMARKNESLKRFANFTYSTRQSSKKFLEFLCSSEFTVQLSNKDSIRKSIENHELFFPFWKKDPTVNSMLFILETIEEICRSNDHDVEVAWNRLTNGSLVYFDFFDLDDFELTDELYVKMNARGKALTDFENFKAWLVKTFKPRISMAFWEKKMDISWNDLFWKKRQENQTKIDSTYLQYFMNMYLSDYLLETYSSNDPAHKVNSDLVLSKLRNSEDNINLSTRPTDIFKVGEVFGNNVGDYFVLLESLASDNFNIDLNKYFVKSSFIEFLLGLQNLTWWDHTYQYALRQYIVKSQDNLDDLQTWARIIGNLIYNSSIETASLHRDACEGINKILEEIEGKDILTGIGLLSDTGYGLAEKQLKEEKAKAKIILDKPEDNWIDVFCELEKHHYFYGQIGFILDLVGEIDFNTFEKVSKKVSVLFSRSVLEDNTHALFRACLAIPSYTPENTHVLVYPSNISGTVRNRTENWRKFFSHHLEIISQLIHHELFNENLPLESLQEIINKSEYTSELIKLLATDYRNLNCAKRNHIRFYPHTCLLLNATNMRGYSVELFTYHWLNNRDSLDIDRSYKIEYDDVKGSSDIPGLLFSNAEKKHKIICDRANGGFFVLGSNNSNRFDTINDAIESLTKQQYAQPN